MRIKITATKTLFRSAQRTRKTGDRPYDCLVALALIKGLGLKKKQFGGCASSFSLKLKTKEKDYPLPPEAIDLISDFDSEKRAANLPARLPVSFFVSVPKKDLEAARAAKG